MDKLLDSTTILFDSLYENKEFTEYITNNFNIKDNSEIPAYFDDIQIYIKFLFGTNDIKEDCQIFSEKSNSILSKFSDEMFWLSSPENSFLKIIELIRNGTIIEDDIPYIIHSAKFIKGFRLYLISMFSNRKKRKIFRSHRKFSELDNIIVKLLENYTFLEENHQKNK